MPKVTPKTTTGRVIARMPEIEEWFREGLKHGEVVARLEKDGMKIHPDYLRQILTTYGVTERKIRRSLGRAVVEEVRPVKPIRKPIPTAALPAPVPTASEAASNEAAETKTKPPSPAAGKKNAPPAKETRSSVAADLLAKQTTQRHKLVVEPRHKKEDVI
jgi:hypothetical protein